MYNNKPTNDNITTRVIPGLSAKYQIVSLPYWAWYWLEDFMRLNRISYKGIYETFGASGDINGTLLNLAELHHEYAMREVYNLANDNEPDDDDIIARIQTHKESVRQKNYNLPKIYKIFGFMACATTLQAVWERRHYEQSNKIN
ncbi:MAG: hypothetical protein R3D88_06660 [Alphaproteobacteria bacterium]|nr:hypothetical protein [Alphaproteobacteria bacterium]